MWGFIIQLGLMLVLQFLRPKTKGPEPANLDQFNVPTAQIGRDIPVLFGTKEICGPNVVWYGDFQKSAIKQSTGLFSKTTVGYRYYIGMHMVLCHGGLGKLLQVKIGSTSAWEGETSGGQVSVNAGDKGAGAVDFLPGGVSQAQNDYLASKISADVPAYRGLISVVLRCAYVGNSPYIEPWSFYTQRIPTSWLPDKACIGGYDMNPVHVIREVLIDQIWGLGIPGADIDNDNFTEAANTVYDEEFGVSLMWDRSATAEDFINEILKYIDAGLYLDRTTGKFMLKLIRNDYNINEIPVLDDTNIIKVEDYKRKAEKDLINTVTIKFWDRETRKEHSFTVADDALKATMGGTNAQENNYIGITSRDLANYIAARDLATLSKPLVSAIITTTREGATLKYGDPFLWEWPRYGIAQAVMRVTGIEYLDITKNLVRIECVQDVFGIEESHYTSPPPSGWVNPVGPPTAVAYHSYIEAPYYWLVREGGQTAADALGANGKLAITGVCPGSGSYDVEIWIKPEASYYCAGNGEFCPSCVLGNAIGISETSLSVSGWFDYASVESGTWAIIGTEIIRIDTIGENSLTVGRGCLDTVPVAHASGERICFVQGPYTSTVEAFPSGKTVYAKLLPITPLGKLDIASAAEQSLQFASRAIRPYPPARLRINNQVQPSSLIGDLSIAWKHRDRKGQISDQIIDTETNQSIGPETGTTYTVEIRRQDTGDLLVTKTNLTGESVNIEAAEIGYNGNIYLLAWSVREDYDSFQKQRRDFAYSRT